MHGLKHSLRRFGLLTASVGLVLACLTGGVAAADPIAPPVPSEPLGPPPPRPPLPEDTTPPDSAARHDIVCFYQAGGPFKTNVGPMAPISFGFSVNCNDEPDVRGITTTLWRFDFERQEYFPHAVRYTNETDATQSLQYYASCSNSGIQYAFHTEVVGTAYHGTWDETTDNSDSVIAFC